MLFVCCWARRGTQAGWLARNNAFDDRHYRPRRRPLFVGLGVCVSEICRGRGRGEYVWDYGRLADRTLTD
jgi:hypothetical protein